MEVSALVVAFLPHCPWEGNPCPGTPCTGKCQLLDAGTMLVHLGLRKLRFWGEDGASWEPRLCMGHKVLPVLEGPTGPNAGGLDMSARELLRGAQEKDVCLGFLQGSRYFAPGKWCHIFPATDKVKPLIWLKV